MVVEEREGMTSLDVDRGLLVTAATGQQLLLHAAEWMPLDMFMTTRAAYIDEYLARASDLRRITPAS
jgi:hypothetical protein